ncbi:hypothetical protein [Acidianus sp. RZ1]|uniref:hypothetical protein n=1 Tax=Acidianus sp. RZ1 TaxID=1540082 RepID=UPI001492550E|nr:hypothetical protein [Acidianus sp. RZ1]NON61183.1 hypothetical protein [Acidianus sp. RZ1]
MLRTDLKSISTVFILSLVIISSIIIINFYTHQYSPLLSVIGLVKVSGHKLQIYGLILEPNGKGFAGAKINVSVQYPERPFSMITGQSGGVFFRNIITSTMSRSNGSFYISIDLNSSIRNNPVAVKLHINAKGEKFSFLAPPLSCNIISNISSHSFSSAFNSTFEGDSNISTSYYVPFSYSYISSYNYNIITYLQTKANSSLIPILHEYTSKNSSLTETLWPYDTIQISLLIVGHRVLISSPYFILEKVVFINNNKNQSIIPRSFITSTVLNFIPKDIKIYYYPFKFGVLPNPISFPVSPIIYGKNFIKLSSQIVIVNLTEITEPISYFPYGYQLITRLNITPSSSTNYPRVVSNLSPHKSPAEEFITKHDEIFPFLLLLLIIPLILIYIVIERFSSPLKKGTIEIIKKSFLKFYIQKIILFYLIAIALSVIPIFILQLLLDTYELNYSIFPNFIPFLEEILVFVSLVIGYSSFFSTKGSIYLSISTYGEIIFQIITNSYYLVGWYALIISSAIIIAGYIKIVKDELNKSVF